MKQLFALLLLLVIISCSKESRLQNAVDYIGQAEAFMGDAVGLAGTKPEVYRSYEQVLGLASPDQLFELISDDRAAVRIYGFQGMVETNHPETFTAFKKLVTDTTALTTMNGCFMSSGRINVLATNLLTNNGLKRGHYQLKGQERVVFDSLILFSDNSSLLLWTMALENVAPVDKHYQAVKRLAYDSSSISAQTGLANFQREEDLDFLRSDFSINDEFRYINTMDIITRFPHQYFLPYLKEVQLRLLNAKILDYNSTYLYLAILQYSEENIKPFLEVVDGYQDEGKKQAHQQGAWAAAQLNNDPAKQQLVKAVPFEEDTALTLAWLKGLAKYSDLQ